MILLVGTQEERRGKGRSESTVIFKSVARQLHVVLQLQSRIAKECESANDQMNRICRVGEVYMTNGRPQSSTTRCKCRKVEVLVSLACSFQSLLFLILLVVLAISSS